MNKQMQPPERQFRIYISDGGTKFYLRDVIVCDKNDHYFFDVDRRFAMTFRKMNTAMKYRERMILLNYHPHIEPV